MQESTIPYKKHNYNA